MMRVAARPLIQTSGHDAPSVVTDQTEANRSPSGHPARPSCGPQWLDYREGRWRAWGGLLACTLETQAEEGLPGLGAEGHGGGLRAVLHRPPD